MMKRYCAKMSISQSSKEDVNQREGDPFINTANKGEDPQLATQLAQVLVTPNSEKTSRRKERFILSKALSMSNLTKVRTLKAVAQFNE